MKIILFYFSGTGNTKKVIDECVQAFQAGGAVVTLKAIENYLNQDIDFDLNEYDKIGFAYPIHAFNAPELVVKFAKKLHKTQAKKDLFIIKTSGEPLWLNNVSSLKLKSILKRRKMILKNEYHYCMPYNIIFRHTDDMAYRMWESAKAVIPIDCQEILTGKPVKLKPFPFGSFLAWLFRIEYWGARFNGKRYKVNNKCIQCGMCARRCPTNNIKIEDGKFKFGKDCIMCMRCSFFCPTDAIKIGFFEKWKVNGAYSFQPGDAEEKSSHQNYCKKAYIKYFARLDEKIKKHIN